MNHNQFMDKISQIIKKMDEKAAKNCLHEMARRTSGQGQEEMLELFSSYVPNAGKTVSGKKVAVHRMSQEYVDEKMKEMDILFEKFENGELSLKADGYEDYSEGYWSDKWIWEYHDPDCVCRELAAAIRFAEDCMSDCRYEEALLVYDRVLDISVCVESDGDGFELRLEELAEERLLEQDLKQLALHVLYTDYQVQKTEKRAEDMYAYFAYGFFREIHIEEIFSSGKEALEDEDKFWQDWIEILSDKNGDLEARLLEEAVLYYRGEDGLLEIAEKKYKSHPSLYLKALEECEKRHEYGKMEVTGEEALNRLDVNLVLRGEIALKTAAAAKMNNHTDKMKACWYEAFVSDSTCLNLLRLFQDKESAEKYGMQAGKVLLGKKAVNSYVCKSNELRENKLDRDTLYCLHFFAGNFMSVKQACKNPEGSLGWTGEFIGKGIKLFLLYLYAGKLSKGGIYSIAASLASDFGFKDNLLFIPEQPEATEEKRNVFSFWNAFITWRTYFPMSQEKENTFLAWIEEIVRLRTKAIVGGKHRYQYDSAAELIAALGEVKESRGEKGGKQKIMLDYKKEYSRFSAFHSELREYGGVF